MQIHGPAHLHGTQAINAPHRAAATQPAETTGRLVEADQLDISHEADMISRMQDTSDIRADRVAAVRAQIEAGVYETSDKLDIAVDRLLDALG
jgi:negative regulator of flagellin synthesis FlgM